MYEGGPDTAGPLQWERPTDLLLNCIAAHRDARMRDLILHDMYNNWFMHPDIQGDVFIYFTLQSAFSRWGMWGLTEDINNLGTSKYQAITDLAGLTKSIPPIPLNVSAAENPGQVTLSWAPSYGANYYMIYRSESGGEYQVIAQVTATTFTDSGLDNPRHFFYTVSAANSLGESAQSSAISTALWVQPTPTATPAMARVEALQAATPPVIDGKIDEAWKNAPAYPITHLIGGEVKDASDLSGQVSALYDQDNLYLLFTIVDDSLVQEIGNNSWDDDSVEVYLDGRNNKAQSYDSNDEQLVFAYNMTEVWAQRGKKKDVVYVITPTENGYVAEIKIPWAVLRVTPEAGMIIGFDAHINDDDDGVERDGKLALYAWKDDSWTNPSTFGIMILK